MSSKLRRELGGFAVEEYSESSHQPLDNLAIVLCTYFSEHEERPIDDVDTESDDNSFWGEWVKKKTDEALELLEKQITNFATSGERNQ